jgi:hypothetical protein
MKTFFLGLIAASAMLVSGAAAQAGFIVGGVGLSGGVQNPTTGSLLTERLISPITKTSGSGDFSAVPNFTTVWGSFTLTSPMTALTITSAGFGSFLGVMLTDSGETNLTPTGGSRTLTFSGSFTAGTSFAEGKRDATAANLTVTLNRSFNDPILNFTSTIDMTTFNAPPPSVVPEPASMAIFGLGAIGFAARRFRRK